LDRNWHYIPRLPQWSEPLAKMVFWSRCMLSGCEAQLHAHICGARNMGVSQAELDDIPKVLAEKVGLSGSAWPKGEPNTAYAQYFVGNSYLAPMDGGIANVTFEPRCRNNWHIHHGAIQVLICVSGRGWYQEWGKPAVPMTPGTIIAIPAEVKHWHGAACDSWFQHLTYHKDVQDGANRSAEGRLQGKNEWLEPVTDEIYDVLK